MVLRVCRRVLGHEQDTEDAFQAAFLVLAGHAVSIRKKEALASWLHGVAFRVAMKARRAAGRRRAHEREVRAMTASTSAASDWRDVQAVLDEEIQGLPDRYRAPFVLCFLEGKSQGEAARELGLKEGTVWSRLSQARKRLQRQLTRRGVSLSALLGAAALSEAAAAVPAGLFVSTVQAAGLVAAGQQAAAGAASAKAAALAKGVSRILFITKGKLIALCLLTAGIVALGADLVRQCAASAQPVVAQRQPPPGPPPKGAQATAQPEAAVEEKGDKVAVHGRVLGPDGRPVGGVEITLWWHFGYEGYYRGWHPTTAKPLEPKAVGKTGPDGQFRFAFAKAELDENPMSMWPRSWRIVQVVAAAKGYGPAWACLEGVNGREFTLKLVPDDVPIRGRVIDLQGRPVAGAAVRPVRVTRGNDTHNSLWQTGWAGLAGDVTTDREGRFTVTGVGRERNALVEIDGPGIEHKLVGVRTEAGPPVEVVVGPAKPIEGTVRDRDTGKPVPGVVIYGEEAAHHRRVRAVTDEQGRYRLAGLAKAGSYQITAYPPVAQRYLGALRRVADTEALLPIAADVELRRGVEVRCRLIDRKTRKPVEGVLQYTPLKTNPHYSEAEWQTGLVPTREFERIHVPDPDGVFHLVVYPGPGLLLSNLQANSSRYLPARRDPADEETAGGDPHLGWVKFTGGYRVINPRPTDKPLLLDIELDPAPETKNPPPAEKK
jgi:RNA polymerase sigma factor (sigma-70 family)